MAADGELKPADSSGAPDDVCILVEGTYPYVTGGVSAWVHDIVLGHPELTFSILNIGSRAGTYSKPRYTLPANVSGLHQVYCQDSRPVPPAGAEREALDQEIRRLGRGSAPRSSPSRVLTALRRLHFDEPVDARMLADLISADISVGEFLHGREAFDLLSEVARRLAPETSFLDFFWHFRAIHVPILRLLETPPVRARCYHAVSTGYAGLVAAAWSARTGRPMILTEHGIYSRERAMDLARASWIKDHSAGPEDFGGATASPLRSIWSRSFRAMAAIAYHQATDIVTLSDVNRRRQIEDGASGAKIAVVPNGVDVSASDAAPAGAPEAAALAPPDEARPLRVGFVGRVVPIKDVITFIKACDLAMHTAPLDVRIIGPTEEDLAYVRRCRDLVEILRRQASIAFVGPKPSHLIYADLDVVVLTSFSEGQPLVMLEAYAAGLPVIASDVGACREMIEGRGPADQALGPSGITTRVACPTETAAALVRMAREPGLRRTFGAAGLRRVRSSYRRQDMIESYRAFYRKLVTHGRDRLEASASH
jgi:glycosyltransferase involved in cell wall biosynthesis